MSIFMFLLLPLSLVLYCFCYRENKKFPLIAIGIMSAVIVCALRMFFFYPHRIVPFSFASNFFYLLIKECFLPAVILYGVFFLISKDSLEYKIKSIFPLEISFYLVYFPYAVINSSSGFMEPYTLIVKPIVYVAMFAAVSIIAVKMYRLLKEKSKIWLAVLYGFLIVVYLICPAVIESVYLLNTKLWIAIIFAFVYVAYPCVIGIFEILKILKRDDGDNSEYKATESFFEKYKFDQFNKLDN